MEELNGGIPPHEGQEQGGLPDQGQQPNLEIQGHDQQQGQQAHDGAPAAREARYNVSTYDAHTDLI